ncbi:MAG: SDR family oxidoreductase [Rubrivivax sp.]|jgi:NAD(P)-dependent dehydrogenase (short-subunit alcohol dehydrogenase family)|nr:SDR family oxidoreductase [Rubrivivax sp.]
MSDRSSGIAVITGAASGFGLEAARIAARRGMKVVLADVQPDALELAAHEIQALGAQVLARRTDVSRAADIEALADATVQRFGVPNFVFNNAGVGGGGGLIWEASAKDWDWVLGVNLMGVVHGVRIFTPLMLAAAARDPAWRGHIVNTASMAGLLSPPNMGVYNTSKHAVVSLSETLYQDLALVTEQVHAHVLCPFFVPTGIHVSHRNRPADLTDADARPTKSQLIAQAMSEKAVTSGKVTAAQVAQFVYDAMADNRFYVFSHPKSLASVQQRMEDLLQRRNPSDPFADRPQVGEQLRAALRAAG